MTEIKVFEGLDIIKARPLGYVPGVGSDGLWWPTLIALDAMVNTVIVGDAARRIAVAWLPGDQVSVWCSESLEIPINNNTGLIDNRFITILGAISDSRSDQAILNALAVVNGLSSDMSVVSSDGSHLFRVECVQTKVTESVIEDTKQDRFSTVSFHPNPGILPGPFDHDFFKSELSKFSESHAYTEIEFHYEP
jgi:DNA gyrase/topoisomerase IV subunit B